MVQNPLRQRGRHVQADADYHRKSVDEDILFVQPLAGTIETDIRLGD